MTMPQRPKYAQNLAPSAPTIIQKPVWGGQPAERMLKKPREAEIENIDICLHHCPHPEKCSGTKDRMEKCRREIEKEKEV